MPTPNPSQTVHQLGTKHSNIWADWEHSHQAVSTPNSLIIIYSGRQFQFWDALTCSCVLKCFLCASPLNIYFQRCWFFIRILDRFYWFLYTLKVRDGVSFYIWYLIFSILFIEKCDFSLMKVFDTIVKYYLAVGIDYVLYSVYYSIFTERYHYW